MKRTFVALSLCSLSVTAFGHHSMVEFRDSETIELTGVISDVQWGNPHVRLELLVRDDLGGETLWRLEGFPRSQLERSGVPSNVVAVGDVVTVAGDPSSRRAGAMYVRNILLPDRTELVLGWFSQARWPQASRAVGGDVLILDEAKVRESEETASGLFRVWTPRRGNRGGWPEDLPLTNAAEARRSTFDVIRDNPYANCVMIGMPKAMFSAWPIEFVDGGNEIYLRLEASGQIRTIHLSADELPEARPSTPLGYSAGNWDEGTLVVQTTGIDYGYFNTADGTPQSPYMEVSERFTLSEDRRQLSYEVLATDPETFTRPVTGSTNWDWTPGFELTLHECVPDA